MKKFALWLIALGALFAPSSAWASCEKEVVMFMYPWCDECTAASRFLIARGIKLEQVNLYHEDLPWIREHVGTRKLPYMIVGEYEFFGFQPRALKKVLCTKN